MSLHLVSPIFFFDDPPTTEIYTLSLHDALPILPFTVVVPLALNAPPLRSSVAPPDETLTEAALIELPGARSEEHTSELQSQSNLVCRLLLEKKKTTSNNSPTQQHSTGPITIPDR